MCLRRPFTSPRRRFSSKIAHLSPIAAGLAGSAAFLVRPALLPGVSALALLPLTAGRARRLRVVAFIVVVLAGVALQGWLQWYLYGSPSRNGYGTTAELFSFRYLGANVRSYPYWGAVMNGPLWIGGLVAGLRVSRHSSAPTRGHGDGHRAVAALRDLSSV